MTPSISDILDRLTEAQKRALLDNPFGEQPAGDAYAASLTKGTARALYRKGLTESEGYHSPLTPLGLEVQSALRASEGNRS